MATDPVIYNTLPTLEEADKRFVERQKMLVTISSLLASYGNKFGLCLVHTHCTLTAGEIMLANGNISEPALLTDTTVHYPERWLANGQAYEFTSQPTEPPPAELIAEFQRLVGSVGVLGLYYAGDEDKLPKLESTEGRKNITRMLAATEDRAGYIETAWNPAREHPVTMACTIYCDATVTRGQSYHKSTRSHRQE